MKEGYGARDVMGVKDIRASRLLLAFAFVWIFLGSGCTRTVVGGFVDSPGNTYRVYTRGFGGLGAAYVDETSKQYRISVVTTGSIGSEKDVGEVMFDFPAAARLSSKITWTGEKEFAVQFFDYGDGVSGYDVKNDPSKRRKLGVAVFTYSEETGCFACKAALQRPKDQ